ncbi:MAG: biotin transporter BioY [Eubacteriales bacterium]
MASTTAQTNAESKNRNSDTKTRNLVFCALMAAVMCVLSPFAVPVGPVPITLATLVLYFMIYIIGWKRSIISTAIYILLGIVGLPVFSGGNAGPGVIAGPTGGFIIGYIPMIVVMGILMEKHRTNSLKDHVLCMIYMIIGTVVLYAVGLVWFMIMMQSDFATAFAACCAPFIVNDLIKMALAMIFGPMLHSRLARYTD